MKHRLAAGTMLLAGGALAGGLVAGSVSANAADGSSSASSSAPSAGTTTGPRGDLDGDGPAGAGGHAGETVVTGSKAATLKAAALEAVPGGTVDRVETDSGDAAYEVHLTEADGSQVTVKFDQSLTKTSVEAGMGK